MATSSGGVWDKIKWIFDEVETFFVDLWASFLDSIVSLIDLVPVPAFFAQANAYTIPSEISFYAVAFEIPAGVSIIVGAYIARFLIRRIPIIG